MPSVLQGAAPLNMNPPKPAAAEKGVPRKVVYVPACVTRIMGPSKGDYETGERPAQWFPCLFGTS